MEHRTHNRNEIVFWQSSRYGEKHVLLSLFRYQEIKTHAIVRTDQIPPAKPKVKHRCDLHFICIHDTRDNSHFWGTPHTLPGYLFDRWKKSACPEGGSPACQAGIQREQPVTPEFKINFLKRKRRFCGMCAFWKDVAREADGLRKKAINLPVCCESCCSKTGILLPSDSPAFSINKRMDTICDRNLDLFQLIASHWTHLFKNTGMSLSEYPNHSAEWPAHWTHHFLVNGRCCDRLARSDEAEIPLPSDSPLSIRFKNQQSVLPICLSCSLV